MIFDVFKFMNYTKVSICNASSRLPSLISKDYRKCLLPQSSQVYNTVGVTSFKKNNIRTPSPNVDKYSLLGNNIKSFDWYSYVQFSHLLPPASKLNLHGTPSLYGTYGNIRYRKNFSNPSQWIHSSSLNCIADRLLYPPRVDLKLVQKDENIQSNNVENVEVIIERENVFTVPNLLCISRMVCAPIISYLILTGSYEPALWLFLGAGSTDLVDGWIARNFAGQSSKLGSFLDPLADKVLVTPVFLSLAYSGIIPFMLTAMIVYRDCAIVSAASWVRYQSLPKPKTLVRYFDATHATVELAPTTISKINTCVQLTLVTACLANMSFHPFESSAPMTALWILTGVTTFSSGLSYIFSKDTYRMLSEK